MKPESRARWKSAKKQPDFGLINIVHSVVFTYAGPSTFCKPTEKNYKHILLYA